MDVLATTTYSPIPSVRGGGGGGAAIFPSNQHHLLKSPFTYPNLSVSKPSSSSKRLSAPSTPHPPPKTLAGQTHHKRAAAGYAAALIDFSRRSGTASFNAVVRDARRFTIAVAGVLEDLSMRDEERIEAIRGVVEGGGFDRRLVALVRMVTAKGEGAGAIAEVLREFWRRWREMNAAAAEMEVVVGRRRGRCIGLVASIW